MLCRSMCEEDARDPEALFVDRYPHGVVCSHGESPGETYKYHHPCQAKNIHHTGDGKTCLKNIEKNGTSWLTGQRHPLRQLCYCIQVIDISDGESIAQR